MQDRKVVRRRRAVFAVLVLLSMGLLTAAFGESPGPARDDPARGAGGAVADRVRRQPARSSRSATRSTGSATRSTRKDENEQLEAEVETLRRRPRRSPEGHPRHRAAPGHRGRPARRPVSPRAGRRDGARDRAIARPAWYSTVQINKGSGDGVRVDQPVIAGDGLAGKVTETTGGTATVALITDADQRGVGRRSCRTARAVCSGPGRQPGGPAARLRRARRGGGGGLTVVTSGLHARRGSSRCSRAGSRSEGDAASTLDELELYQRVHVEPVRRLQADRLSSRCSPPARPRGVAPRSSRDRLRPAPSCASASSSSLAVVLQISCVGSDPHLRRHARPDPARGRRRGALRRQRAGRRRPASSAGLLFDLALAAMTGAPRSCSPRRLRSRPLPRAARPGARPDADPGRRGRHAGYLVAYGGRDLHARAWRPRSARSCCATRGHRAPERAARAAGLLAARQASCAPALVSDPMARAPSPAHPRDRPARPPRPRGLGH